jgi:phosphatidylethanolamine-binding protein (PEBP) family uncharacterized protein
LVVDTSEARDMASPALVYHRAMSARPGIGCDRIARSLSLLLAACGGGDGDAVDAGSGADAADFALTSSAFAEGGAIPLRHTCPPDGEDLSPPLAWSGGPDAAGYALVLTDLSNQLVHSVLWDIPGETTSLPEAVEKVAEPPVPPGSKQALAYDGQTRGYRGPCPPEQHTYEFALHAVGEDPLPGATLDSSRDELVELLAAEAIATARLTGTFTPSDAAIRPGAPRPDRARSGPAVRRR